MGIGEKRCKASKSEFKEIWPGLKRCMVCGFALASYEDTKHTIRDGRAKSPKEDTLHATYHGKFYKVKSQYGYSNVLDYKTLKEKESTILKSLKSIKGNDISSEKENLIDYFNRLLDIINELNKELSKFVDSSNLASYIISNCGLIQSICNDTLSKDDIFDMGKSVSSTFLVFKDIAENLKEIVNEKSITFSFNIEKEYSRFESFSQVISSKMIKVDEILTDLYTIEFTRSIRLWDMCKAHPKFEDYIALLWNTPKFLNFIKSYMTQSQLYNYAKKYIANRQLVDFYFEDVPFYFGNVVISNFCKSHSDCGKDCKNCLYGCRDLSYTDKLVEISDDEDPDISDEITKEDEEVSKNFEALGKLLSR